MVCIKTRIYNLFGLSVLNNNFIYSLSATITTNLSVNPQNRFRSQEFGFLTRLCPPSCLFWRAVDNMAAVGWRISHQYRVTLLVVGGCRTFSFSEKYLLFKLFCSYSLTWSLAVTCSISILLWVFCSCAYSFYRSNRVGFILNLSLLRRKIILVRWVTLQSQSLSFSGYFPFFITHYILHWNNQFDRRLCAFPVAVFCDFKFIFLNLVLISQHHDTFYTSSSVLFCLSVIKSYKNYTWRHGGLFFLPYGCLSH